MLKKFKKRRSVLKTYIITYCLVFAIPLILFSLVIYRRTVSQVSQQFISTTQTAANGVSENLGKLFELTGANASFVRENPYFSSSYMDEHAGAFVYLDKNMHNLISINNSFSQLAFYSTQTDMFYSDSMYSHEFYFKNRFHTQYLNSETDLTQIHIPTYFPMTEGILNGAENILCTIVYPVEKVLQNGKRQSRSLIVFHLDYNQMKKLLSPITAVPGTHAIVYQNNAPIFADDYNFFRDFIETEEANKVETGSTAAIGGELYEVQVTKYQNQVTIYSFLSQKQLKLLANDIMFLYILALMVSTSIAAILIFFSVQHNYRPILRLLHVVTGESSTASEDMEQLDEMGKTYYALDTIIEHKKKTELDNRNIKLEHILWRLMENSAAYIEQPSFERRKNELELDLNSPFYWCVIFTDCTDSHALMAYFEQDGPQMGFRIYCANDIDKSNVAALFCSSEEQNNSVVSFLEKIKTLYASASIGRCVNSLKSITISYKEAYYATLHTTTEQSIYFYDVVQNIRSSDILARFARESELFSAAVSHKERNRMRVSLSHISDLFEILPDSFSTSFLLHHILFVTVKALAAANLPFDQTTALFAVLPQTYDFVSISNWLSSLSIHLDQLLEASPESENAKADSATPVVVTKDFQYVLLYINTNYSKPDFSIKTLAADELGMSVSNFSHYFKSRQGINLSDYINSLRIEEAKRLLRESHLRITDIIPHLGYNHVSSFTKAFKKATGMTPTEYKHSLHQEEHPI